MANPKNTTARTVTMSDEAWAMLRALAARQLRPMNAHIEFLIREAATTAGIQADA